MSVGTTMSERDDRRDGTDATASGVDVTLIEEMRRLSPGERLRQNDRMAALAVRLRDAFAAGESGKADTGGKGWKTPGS
jgi:hypothetical protein